MKPRIYKLNLVWICKIGPMCHVCASWTDAVRIAKTRCPWCHGENGVYA